MDYKIILEKSDDNGIVMHDGLVDATEEEGGALVIYSAEGAGGNTIRTKQHIRLYVSDSCIIDQKYEAAIGFLVARYKSIFQQAVVPEQICFTIDAHWVPSEASNDNSVWKIDIGKATKWLRAFGQWGYEIRLRKFWLDEWSEAQLHAALLSQLLRIDPAGDGSIRKYSLEFQDPLSVTFGQGYLNRGVDIPDVMVKDIPIKWAPEASGQLSIFEAAVPEGGLPPGEIETQAI